MRGEHDRLLPAQQSRQHHPPAGCQHLGEVAGQQRQRARQDVRQHQVVARSAQRAVAVSRRPADPHQPHDAVADDVMPGDPHGTTIDIARQNLAAQQFRRGDREDPGARADVERAAETDGAAPGSRAPSGKLGSTDVRRFRTRSPRRPGCRSRQPAHDRDNASHRQRTGRPAEAGRRAGSPPASRGPAASPRRSRQACRRPQRRRVRAAPRVPGSAPPMADRLRRATPAARSRRPKPRPPPRRAAQIPRRPPPRREPLRRGARTGSAASERARHQARST